MRVQAEVDRMVLENRLPEAGFRVFHPGFTASSIGKPRKRCYSFMAKAENSRCGPANGVRVPEKMSRSAVISRPSSARVGDFMDYFEMRYRFDRMGKASRIMAMAAAHHRLNYIHPFPDGKGRVSRLMSHAMVETAGDYARGAKSALCLAITLFRSGFEIWSSSLRRL